MLAARPELDEQVSVRAVYNDLGIGRDPENVRATHFDLATSHEVVENAVPGQGVTDPYYVIQPIGDRQD